MLLFLANNYAHLGLFTEAYKYARLYQEKDQMGEFTEDVEELLDLIGIDENEDLEILEEQEEIINQQEAAQSHLESGDYASAMQILEKTVEDHPEYWPAYNNLALAYFYEGETKKAAGIIEKVLSKARVTCTHYAILLFFYFMNAKQKNWNPCLPH